MSVSKKVLEHPVLTICVFALIAIVAAFTLGDIQIDLMPDTDMPIVMIYTSYENAGPESVESSVTEILESGLISVSNLNQMTSTSSEGSSLISLEFGYGTNLDTAVNDIRDKLDMVKGNLPDDCDNPQIFKFDSSSMPIMTLALNGNRSADEMRSLADDVVSDKLEQTAGIAQASVTGGRESIVRVELSQNRLDAYGLTLSSIATTLASQNIEIGGGSVFEGTRKFMVRTTGEFTSIDEINDTVVGTINGYDVKLSDIGIAFMGHEDQTSEVFINGKPGVYIKLQKQSGSNTVNVANAVYAKIAEIQATLPEGVSLDIISDDSTAVRDTLKSLIESISQGFVLSIIVLFIFLRSAKSTLIMAISIPFSVLITVLVMVFTGVTLNMITMTGLILGIGMVVDASVVVLENIYSYRERGTEPDVAAAIGTQEVMSSVISGNLTTICVFIPFFVYKSKLEMLGELFATLMIVIIIALLSSLFVAMFLVPVLAGKFLKVDNRKEKPLKNKVLKIADSAVAGAINWLTEKYRIGLHAALTHRFATVLIAFTILVSSILFFTHLRVTFMSNFNDTSVGLNVELPLGTKLSETENILNQFYEIVKSEIQGYENIVVSVGTTSSNSLSADTSYKGSITITLPDASVQIDNADTIKAKLRRYFSEFPTAEFTFDEGRMQQMTGSDIDIVFKGNDLDEILVYANELKSLMSERIPEIVEPELDLEEGLPQVEIKIDRARASSFGISVNAIANEINYSINGKTATTYRAGGDDYSVVLLLADEDRSDIPDLENIFVTGTSGRYAVSNFAQIVRGTGPVSITREDKIRVVHLTANLVGSSSAGEIENQIKSVMESNMIIPESITVSFEGSWKDTMNMMQVFLTVIILAVVLVFGVMAGTYESFKSPFINMFTLPFLLVGIVVIHMITGQAFSMVSMLGVVLLVGIVVNNGIILVDQTNLLVDRGMKVLEACENAGASRLRPVLMTTLTTILGMIPMAFFGDANSSTTQPIGLCIIGGLTSSTIVTLFIIPVLYSLFNRSADNRKAYKIAPELQKRLNEKLKIAGRIAASEIAEENESEKEELSQKTEIEENAADTKIADSSSDEKIASESKNEKSKISKLIFESIFKSSAKEKDDNAKSAAKSESDEKEERETKTKNDASLQSAEKNKKRGEMKHEESGTFKIAPELQRLLDEKRKEAERKAESARKTDDEREENEISEENVIADSENEDEENADELDEDEVSAESEMNGKSEETNESDDECATTEESADENDESEITTREETEDEGSVIEAEVADSEVESEAGEKSDEEDESETDESEDSEAGISEPEVESDKSEEIEADTTEETDEESEAEDVLVQDSAAPSEHENVIDESEGKSEDSENESDMNGKSEENEADTTEENAVSESEAELADSEDESEAEDSFVQDSASPSEHENVIDESEGKSEDSENESDESEKIDVTTIEETADENGESEAEDSLVQDSVASEHENVIDESEGKSEDSENESDESEKIEADTTEETDESEAEDSLVQDSVAPEHENVIDESEEEEIDDEPDEDEISARNENNESEEIEVATIEETADENDENEISVSEEIEADTTEENDEESEAEDSLVQDSAAPYEHENVIANSEAEVADSEDEVSARNENNESEAVRATIAESEITTREETEDEGSVTEAELADSKVESDEERAPAAITTESEKIKKSKAKAKAKAKTTAKNSAGAPKEKSEGARGKSEDKKRKADEKGKKRKSKDEAKVGGAAKGASGKSAGGKNKK